MSALNATQRNLEIIAATKIVYQNHNRKVTGLKHIFNNLFVLEENAQIEFFKDRTGLYSSIKMYLNAGNVFEEVKNSRTGFLLKQGAK